MNLRILLKAMSFMFLPTLAVLLILLVGFFDPVAMWNFIKSNDGWAIFTRVLILIAEIAFVSIMYSEYSEKEIKEKARKGIKSEDGYEINGSTYVYSMFGGSCSSKHIYKKYSTETEDIIVIERTKKEE